MLRKVSYSVAWKEGEVCGACSSIFFVAVSNKCDFTIDSKCKETWSGIYLGKIRGFQG